MSTILYLDGSCGISGDMTVAALLDLGADPKKLDTALEPLKHEGLSWTISRKSSHGIAGCDFDVHLAHDDHGHHHHHDHGHHHHAHRHLADVNDLLETLPLTPAARALAKRIFRIVAEAEAKAHGTTLEAVHFHEVGALDSLADIVGAAVLVDDLGITECVISPLAEGTGTVHCAHGELPVPVPAVLNIAQAHRVPMRITPVAGERITPTGIAIAAALRTQDNLPERFTVQACGVGLGKRDFGVANTLRAMILEADEPEDGVTLLETNLDDITGEALAHAVSELQTLGARDVTLIPCYMKKGRPGTILQVQCDSARETEFAECIFRETTAIGLRKMPLERICMTRESVTLALEAGEVMGKRCTYGSCERIYPEYESVSALARATGIPFSTLFAAAEAEAKRLQQG